MPELNVEIDRLVLVGQTGTQMDVTKGEAVEKRQDALKDVAKSLDKAAVDELIGEDAEGIVLTITRRQPVKIT